jgi:oligoribonuclease NrnB/cAMP/cGMP phosphodiesterase (DHH superfamily)
MKCFYHSADFDGKCSGAIVRLKHPDCDLIGIDYGDPFPWDSVHDDEVLFMVDFAVQPNTDMERLYAKTAGKLVWIDHHKTALEWAGLSGFDNVCKGVRALDLAACELTWNYLYPQAEMPEVVWLLGRYDIWKHDNPRVLPFQYGMRLLNPAADDVGVWRSLFDGHTTIEGVVEKGLIVQAAQEQSHAGVCKMAGFDLEWEGLRWTAVNGPYRGSMVHKSRFDHIKHDAMLGFYWTGSLWMLSLTTDKPDVDVSSIAKKYGGGGHKGAAGFQSPTLPFSLAAEAAGGK